MLKFNYGEYVFQQLITTEFVQLKLAHILISLAANCISLHLATVLCLIVSVNIYIDFFLQIAISVICSLKINHIYNFVERYEAEFYALTQYLINNYSIDNYRYWKRVVVIGVCIYACVLLAVVQITNWILFLYIIQYAICFLTIEQFEQQRVQYWIKEYQNRPVAKVLTDDPASDFLINSYLSPRRNVLRTRRSSASTANELPLIGNDCSGSISSGSNKPNYRQGLTDQVNRSALRGSVTGGLRKRKSASSTDLRDTSQEPHIRSSWARTSNHTKPYNKPPNY
jgi:hypothetical protein